MFYYFIMMLETADMDYVSDIPCWFYHNKNHSEEDYYGGKCHLKSMSKFPRNCDHCEDFANRWVYGMGLW